jgi:prepilin-type N-terminal cleavage/methylation domain-containing protein
VARKRVGYTLLELIVVLAIVVMLAGLAYLYLDSLQAGPRLAAAADLLRARLNEARMHALQERLPYRFAVKEGTGCFRIAPDTSDYWEDGAATPAHEEPVWVYEGSLPEQVIFAGGDGSSSWRTLVTFQPDGTSTEDVELVLQTRGAPPTTLRLRGATGALTQGGATAPRPGAPVLLAQAQTTVGD